MAIISDDLAQAINNMSPAAQNAQLGTRLQEALAGELPSGSISEAELAGDAVTAAKIKDGEVKEAELGTGAVTEGKIGTGAVSNAKLAANAVNLAKIAAGLSVVVAVEDAHTTDRDENRDGLSSSITLANSLKTIMNAHAADAAEHTTAIDDVNFPVTTDDADDLSSLLSLVGDLLTAYDAHDADAELGVGWAFHGAQEAGDHSLASAVAPTDLNEAITRLNDLKAKYNAHDADATAHATGSTHQEANSDAALGTAILVSETGVAAGDNVQWGILNSGTGSVTGVSAEATTDAIIFTFSAEPQDDAIINYVVSREAT